MAGLPAPPTSPARLPLLRLPLLPADYCAAYTIDRKWMGRKRLQAWGFMMM